MRVPLFIALVVPAGSSGVSHRVKKRLFLFFGFLVLLLSGVYWYYPTYCLNQVQSAFFKQDLLNAKLWIERGLATDRMQPDFAFMQARYNRKKSRFPEMAHYLKVARKLGYKPELVQREAWLARAQAGELKQLESHLHELLQQGEDLSEICDAYVRGCILQYRVDEAIDIISLWEADLPQDPQPCFLKGRLLEHYSDLEGAEKNFRKSIRLSPQYAAAAYNLARILVIKLKYEEAMRYYKKTVELMEVKQPGRIGVAECCIQLQRFDEAQENLDQCGNLDSELLVEASRYLGDPTAQAKAKYYAVYGKLKSALEQYSEAIPYYEQALGLNPHDWRTRYNYAVALKQVGRKEEAQKESERVTKTREALASCDLLIDALRKNPNNVEARFKVGSILYEHISEYQGLMWLKSVLEFDPDHKPTLELLKKLENPFDKN